MVSSLHQNFSLLPFLFIAMSSIFGMAAFSTISNFPAEYLGAYLNGGGMSTIFTACLQILSLAISISTESSALVYFWVANVTIAFTLFLMGVVTRRNRFYQFNMENYKPRKEKMLSFRQIVDIFKVIWPGAGITFFFLITNNTVHPALTSLVVSEGEGNGPWNGETIPSKNSTDNHFSCRRVLYTSYNIRFVRHFGLCWQNNLSLSQTSTNSSTCCTNLLNMKLLEYQSRMVRRFCRCESLHIHSAVHALQCSTSEAFTSSL
jgi:hypothetical protein